MAKLEFTQNNEPSLGIEIELGLVDKETGELASCIHELLEQMPGGDESPYKPELMQCYMEVNTGVCQTVGQAEQDLTAKLIDLERACDKIGVELWWGATHPFSLWREQKVTPNERYENLIDLLQEMARRLVTFGLHVHIGVDSGDKAVMICDRLLKHLPTLLGLSCSSPFWNQRQTGLQSHRTKIMEGLPTAGLPPLMRNWSEYTWLVNHMIDTGFINTIREIWWDVRPHHRFGTVEVRVCDMPGNLNDALSIAAYVQCLVLALSDDIDQGAYQHDCHPMLVQQNKWRACRYGHKAQLVDAEDYQSRSLSLTFNSMVERLLPIAKRLDCADYLENVRVMASGPSWADRQVEIFKRTGEPAQIVKQMVQQSRISER